VLIYQRRKHFVNLFVWPAGGAGADRTMKTISRQGYKLLHWIDAEFNYWAVSDISEKELQEFKQLFEEQIVHH
jgi:anti-sigma factor RsiW